MINHTKHHKDKWYKKFRMKNLRSMLIKKKKNNKKFKAH